MNSRAGVLFFALTFFFAHLHAANPILLITIDGLRPDAIEAANARNLLNLIDSGTYFTHDMTVRPSQTLPAHTSILTGLDPLVHGITWDDYDQAYGPVRFPTALEIAHDAGYHVAAVVTKEKLLTLNRPNSTDHFEVTKQDSSDVVKAFGTYVDQAGLPDLTFLHLPDPDKIGHVFGWMSPLYLRHVRKADAAVREIVMIATQASNGLQPTIIITADHGGHNFDHEKDIDKNNHVPFIAVGENVAAGFTNSQPIRAYDVAATLLSLLDLPIPSFWSGTPIPLTSTKQADQITFELCHNHRKGAFTPHTPAL